MENIFEQMLVAIQQAQELGIPHGLIVISLSMRGMKQLLEMTERFPGALTILSAMHITCSPHQDSDVALGRPWSKLTN